MRRFASRLAASAMALAVFGFGVRAAGDERAALDYKPADEELRLALLDSSQDESFLAVQADSLGRLFVGGREALFVYEPDAQGGYGKRQELYRFPEHTWIYDIAIRGRDVYVLTVSALYVIPGAVEQQVGLEPKRLVWGVPLGHVHQCFHGMAIGPEGDIYFAMGDPLWYYGDFNRPDHWGHWTFFSQPEGTRTPYNGVGGVFRCRPDGSQLAIVARGLRNSCGLAFDRHWNLFTNDNDHEQMPAQYVPGRLVHVTPRAYFNWPRGWLLSKTPDRADVLQTMTDELGRAVPVGQAYYHDVLLGEEYRDNLLVARWCTRAVTRYPLVPRGASFRVDEHPLLVGQNQARPVGVSVGRGGRVFVTVAYMAQNEGSPVYRSDLVMITRRDDPPSHPFAPYRATAVPPEKLWRELSDPSWSRRYAAHVELLRRRRPLADAAERLRRAAANNPAIEHLVWLAGASGTPEAAELLVERLAADDPHVRLQAVRALSEFGTLGAEAELFVPLVADADPQVRHAAVLALFDYDSVPEQVIEGPAVSDDTYLRQAATLLLAEKASLDGLARLCADDDAATRMAGVLAAGFRLTLPGATVALPDYLPLDPLRTEEAYTIQFADAKVDLRSLGRVGNYTVADHWKQGHHSPEQSGLFALLVRMLADRDERVRLQTAHFLSLLNDPRSEPEVLKVVARSEGERLLAAPIKSAGSLWVVGPFDDEDAGFQQAHPPQEGPVDLSAVYETQGGEAAWHQLAADGSHYNLAKAFGPGERTSYYALGRLESASRQRVQLLVGSDDGVQVWHNGRTVWINDVVRGALPFQDVVSVQLEPGSNDFLIRVVNRAGDCGLYVHYRSLGEVIAVMPQKVDGASLAERLAAAAGMGQEIPESFLNVDWTAAAAEADPARGRQLFESAGCIKCHALAADAATVGGPSLADAAKRFTVPYLVESVLAPNKQVSPVFRATVVQTVDGRQATGLLIGETAEKVELLLPDGTRQTIAKDQIELKELQALSPMPQGVLKDPDELKHILAFLLSQ